MEFAGVIGMGPPQKGVRPDLLKYILVKGPERGKSTFWVFKQSHETAIPATATAEPHTQPVKAVSNDTTPEASTVKQSAITDFFYPRPSTGHASNVTRRVSPDHSFIKPCPSVRLAEVPALFEVQSDCVVDHYLDPTHPLFERTVLKSCLELPSLESDSSPAEVDLDIPSPKLPDAATKRAIEIKKRFRQYSLPSIAATWHDRMASGSPNDETLLASPAQGSEWSFVASPQLGKGNVPFDSLSSPPGHAASDAIHVTPTEDAEPDDAEADIGKFWMENDEERLAVIKDMKKTMAELKGELANTVTAFQMASEANQKLLAEVEKKTTALPRLKEIGTNFFMISI